MSGKDSTMRLGLHINEMSWGAGLQLRSALADIGDAAEAAGFDSIAMADHVWLSPYVGGPVGNHLEAYTSLAFLAARTQRVRLLTLATAASYRPAGLLAKMVSTLDVLSGGRAMLGIGAGDYEDEARGSASRFRRRSASVSTCSRRRSGPASRCGRANRAAGRRSRASTCGWAARSTSHSPSRGRTRRSSSPGAVSAGRSRSSRSTATPAISGRRRTSRGCSRSSAGPATGKAATTRRSRRPRRSGSTSATTARAVGELIGRLRWLGSLGIETVFGYVVGAERIRPIEIMGREVIPAIAEV